LQKAKRKIFPRLIRIGKRYIEHNLGISLGDTVNLALFALTIAALVFTVIGVAIAWVAFLDAKQGGEDQEQSLRNAESSLIATTMTLYEAKKSLSDINDKIKDSITIEEQQEQDLKQAAALSSMQLKQVQNRQKLHLENLMSH
jgi:hypothetical protein